MFQRTRLLRRPGAKRIRHILWSCLFGCTGYQKSCKRFGISAADIRRTEKLKDRDFGYTGGCFIQTPL